MTHITSHKIFQSPYRLNQHSNQIIFIYFFYFAFFVLLLDSNRIGFILFFSFVFLSHSWIFRWICSSVQSTKNTVKIGFTNAAKQCAIIHHFQWLAYCKRCEKVYFSFELLLGLVFRIRYLVYSTDHLSQNISKPRIIIVQYFKMYCRGNSEVLSWTRCKFATQNLLRIA